MTKDLEIIKLKEMLIKAKIPFAFNNHNPSYQICILDKNNEILCDAIYLNGNYGYDKGLLEIMGALTEEEYENDSVLGYLTADEVFKRFKYCYENNTRTFKEEENNQ